MKLYCVDQRSLKMSMDIPLGNSIKRKDLKAQERTENELASIIPQIKQPNDVYRTAMSLTANQMRHLP
jgi:hypothetical protein